MGSSIRVVLITGALFVLGAYVLAGSVIYKNDAELVDSRHWVIHTYKTMTQLREIQSAVRDCETGQRGYIITGDASYLQPYEEGVNRINELTDELEVLLGDNKLQQDELKRVKPIIASKLAELKESIKTRREKGFDAATAVVKTNLGRATMDHIRSSIERMESTEESLLITRLNRLNRESAKATAYSTCLIGASYILIGVMLALIGRLLASIEQDRRRLKLQYEIARILAEPKSLNDSMTAILKEICDRLDWDLGAYWSSNAERNELSRAFHWHLPNLNTAEFEDASSSLKLARGVGLLGRVWDTGKPIWVPDVTKDASFLRAKAAEQAGLHAALALPIFLSGQLLGVLELFSRSARRTDKNTIASLMAVNSNIAHFIEYRLKKEESDKKEKLLREGERRFRALFDQTFQFISILSPEGIVLESNRSGLSFEGLNPLDVIGHYFWETPWWIDSKDAQEKLKRAVKEAAQGQFVRFEADYAGAKGMINIDFSMKPIFDESGQVVMLIAEGRDISERIRAESALAEREARTRAIVDTAAEGIITIADLTTGVIESANNAAHKMFGFGRGELIGLRVTEIVPKFLTLVEFLAKEQKNSSDDPQSAGHGIEADGQRADGSSLPVEIALSFCKVREQNIITGIVRDITERKEVERRVKEFYSMVSHELRTPLTSIRGSLRLMEGGRTGELPPRAMQLVEIAHTEAERLIRLINDILDVRKIEAGKLELKKSLVEVADLVGPPLETIQGTANASNVKLVSKINAAGKLHCDRDRIVQVITNLLSNAIKFSPDHGQVVLSVEKTPNNYFRFSVTDEGPGIPAKQKHKLFGFFQQLDLSDSRPKGGTGLGLAISKGIIEEHGGVIGVDSVIGKGSSFWFEVPDVAAPQPAEIITRAMPAIHKALLVDDDDKLCQMLSMLLEDQGFRVMRAGSVTEAQVCLEADGNPDVIILDIWLPDGNGLELMDKLGSDDKTDKIPIIILSGKEPEQENYVNPVLVDWIQKPYEEKRLLSALRRAVRRRVSGPARVLIVEDDQPTRELIKQELETLRVECIEAADGITAVHLARTRDPDLIVLDLTMPGLNGFEVVSVLQKERCQKTPLIVYTARDLSEDDKRNLTLGLTTYLVKSRTSEGELIESVKSMLDGLVSKPIAAARSLEG
jgi:PAS domain S-box-containing protein